MPSVYDLKTNFQALLRPLLSVLIRWQVHPNSLTIVALIGSILVGMLTPVFATVQLCWLILPFWLLIRMGLNALDGMLARARNLQSAMGNILNELGDVISDVFLYMPLAVVEPSAEWTIITFVLTAVLTEFCGILGQVIGTARRYDGPMGKSDRALVVGLLALAVLLAPLTRTWWYWIFGITTLLCLATCINRITQALRQVPTLHS